MDGSLPPAPLAATPTATGDSLRDVLVAAIHWAHENERLYFRVGRSLVEALIDRALCRRSADELTARELANKRLRESLERVDQYFDACHSTDGKRLAAGVRSSLEILAAAGYWE